MVFAALIAAPSSAFLCGTRFMPFFAVFPAAALLEGRLRFFRNLFLIALAPLLFFIWAAFSGNDPTAERSFRWICSLSAGVYFASVLGPCGIAAVTGSIRRAPFFTMFSDLMLLTGGASATARRSWIKNEGTVFKERLFATVRDAVTDPEPLQPDMSGVKAVPLLVAVLSWLFLLSAVSGRIT